MALFRSWGLRHIHIMPSGFWGRSGMRPFWFVRWWGCWFDGWPYLAVSFQSVISTLWGLFFLISCILGSGWIMYIPGILPVVSKELGEAFLREMMSWTIGVLWSCGGATLVVWFCKGVIFSADPGICCVLCCYWGWLGDSGSTVLIDILNVTCFGCSLSSVVMVSSVVDGASLVPWILRCWVIMKLHIKVKIGGLQNFWICKTSGVWYLLGLVLYI